MSTHLNTHNTYTKQPDPLLANVRLGSPRFSDCRGVGICAIFLDRVPRHYLNCRDWCQALLSVEPCTGRLLVQFLRHSVSERTFDHHFGSGYLKLQHSYVLEEDVLERLGLAADAGTILPGRYPVLELDDYLLVSCRIAAPAVRTLPVLRHAA